MQTPRALKGVAATSLGVALLRAAESRRPDRLVDDPYAQLVLDAAGQAAGGAVADPAGVEHEFLALMHDPVAVRTRFFDDTLLAAAVHGCRQVVLLASGMDSRAVRLPWPPQTVVYEVDRPDVLDFKNHVFDRAAVSRRGRICVPADLRENWVDALSDAGFRAGQPTAWLVEGILYALPAEAAERLVGTLSDASAPASRLVFDHMVDSVALRQALVRADPALNALWLGGPQEPPADWLSRHGWEPTVHDIVDLTLAVGREVPVLFDAKRPGTASYWLVSATR